MPRYTALQIGQVAYAAGLRGDALAKSIAIAIAESSGRTDVVNLIGATGLWQINEPVWRSADPAFTIEGLKDPQTNARAMMLISKNGTNWHPWSTYNVGAHLIWMSTANKVVAQLKGGATAANPQTTSPFPSDTGGGFTHLPGLGPSTPDTGITSSAFWKRIGLFVAGVIMAGFALFNLLHVGNLVGKAGGIAARVETGGLA